jgi:protein RecA
MGDSHMGLQARLMSQALRKLTGSISRSRTAVIFLNQLREKVGVIFGNPEVTPGGRALKFYSSVRIDLRRAETLKVGNDVVGNRVRAKVVKNKVAPPFRTAEFDLMFNASVEGTSWNHQLGFARAALFSIGQTAKDTSWPRPRERRRICGTKISPRAGPAIWGSDAPL